MCSYIDSHLAILPSVLVRWESLEPFILACGLERTSMHHLSQLFCDVFPQWRFACLDSFDGIIHGARVAAAASLDSATLTVFATVSQYLIFIHDGSLFLRDNILHDHSIFFTAASSAMVHWYHCEILQYE